MATPIVKTGFGSLMALLGTAGTAAAAYPEPWQLNFQKPATEIMERIDGFHDMLLVIITAITLFVLALLVIVMVRYNAKANPNPSKVSHNTLIEVIWTAVPILILVVIAVPSFRILYAVENVPPADITVKAIGQTWYWSYEYAEATEAGEPVYDFVFDSFVAARTADEVQPGQIRLLSTDVPIVVPVGRTVRMLITAPVEGVLHSWAMPAFGTKMDAVPGRINETWFRAEREGTYYGQCSEICGVGHAFMPIEVRVVSDEAYAEWTKQMQEEFARDPDAPPVNVAAVLDLLSGDTSVVDAEQPVPAEQAEKDDLARLPQ
ncbi:MAG: cytochrome c oxidase subunit II [Pseudomonadota bacterium]